MKTQFFQNLLFALLALCSFTLTACNDEEESIVPQLTLNDGQQSKYLAWDEQETSIKFTATADWTAEVKDITVTWLKLSRTKGEAGDISLPLLLEKNDNRESREAILILTCGEKTAEVNIRQEANPNAVQTMDPAAIPDYDKYYTPSKYNEGFGQGPEYMLRSDARWSWFRHKQSEHFFVFWEEGFGDDPNAETVPTELRVDIDDLLDKAEQFYRTNIETLKFAEIGQGKSYLDKYKMQIYLLYQTEWLATGSGYDNTIGALWVNPSTCQPVGSTIAHEIGHSFQYQVYCDKLLQGAADDYTQGFRYGYGPAGNEGGNGFWEQCAQWQSFQDYPAETFGYHVSVWKANYHRHFCHEYMRYASYWLQYYWAQKHGSDVVGKIWTQSKAPEDPLMTYCRLYCNNNAATLYEELYDYAARMATYDLDGVRAYATDEAKSYSTRLYETADGYYQVGYGSCPGTSGFNVIALNVPQAGTVITADFEGMAVGTALAADDPGNRVDTDGNTVGTASTYNNNGGNTAGGWRYGFVAVVNGTAQYAPMHQEQTGNVSYTIPAGTQKLYFIVLGAPEQYKAQVWNDDEQDDEQWPYRVRFGGTDLLGSVTIDPDAQPQDLTLSYELSFPADAEAYSGMTVSLNENGDIAKLAQAFVMQSSAIADALLDAKAAPAEGKIAFAAVDVQGATSYDTTANGWGFWFDAAGSPIGWGETSQVFAEFSATDFSFSIGQYPGHCQAGDKFTIREAMIYTKNGKEYRATFEFNITVK